MRVQLAKGQRPAAVADFLIGPEMICLPQPPDPSCRGGRGGWGWLRYIPTNAPQPRTRTHRIFLISILKGYYREILFILCIQTPLISILNQKWGLIRNIFSFLLNCSSKERNLLKISTMSSSSWSYWWRRGGSVKHIKRYFFTWMNSPAEKKTTTNSISKA